jgi:hypothetical protein
MTLRTISCLLALGGLAAVGPAVAGEPAPPLQPFVAEYAVRYASMSVGSSRSELKRDSGTNRWIFESRASASGFGRLFASGTLVQTSWLVADAAGVRPLRFTFDDGMERRSEDVDLRFDWSNGRVSGSARGELVDLPLEPGLQDPVSSQVAMMLALLAGREPADLPMIDSDKIRQTEVRFERRESVTTPAGSFETLVYTNSRPGGQRVTRMWLAPSLQYLPVRMEQLRRGKLAFSMQLQRHGAGG